jgi:hypothetical protein
MILSRAACFMANPYGNADGRVLTLVLESSGKHKSKAEAAGQFGI